MHKLKGEVKTLQAQKTCTDGARRGSSSKSWESYSRQQRGNIRKRLSSEIRSALSNCSNEHFEPISVELANTSGKKEILDIKKGTFCNAIESTTTESSDDHDSVKFALFVKDKFCLSDEAYHEVALLSGSLPKLHTVKRLTKSLNAQSNISPTVGVIGVEQKVQERLELHLSELDRKGELQAIVKRGNCIRIKLSGDGTKVGRSLHVINFTFTFVDKPTAESVAGNHTLAILKTGEDYSDLCAGFQNISQEIKELSHITINDKQYTIEYFGGGGGLEVSSHHLWLKCC